MKRFFLLYFLGLLLFSCAQNPTQVKKQLQTPLNNSTSFEIKGTLENFYSKKVYLNKIIETSIYPIDSSEIINNHFKFIGIVKFPERFALTFENYSSITPFIIENTPLNIIINSKAITDPLITGSPLNTKLNDYKTTSKNIFKKIDYLFPQFQKARLENDAEKLRFIGNEMKNIEHEFVEFSYQYILQNKDSYVSAMILRDQLKSSTIDTLRVGKMYKILSEEVKKSPDAQIISSFLKITLKN
ncbi:MAG: DUF4369 domain-containing protein [Lutibacter sp.]|uniref:DUF4369 domain-containing protein n=1 Tax=Lutibacter sp. TaxID=1925666 RepID=UPI00385FEEB2